MAKTDPSSSTQINKKWSDFVHVDRNMYIDDGIEIHISNKDSGFSLAICIYFLGLL
jgi:hypothetical protein